MTAPADRHPSSGNLSPVQRSHVERARRILADVLYLSSPVAALAAEFAAVEREAQLEYQARGWLGPSQAAALEQRASRYEREAKCAREYLASGAGDNADIAEKAYYAIRAANEAEEEKKGDS